MKPLADSGPARHPLFSANPARPARGIRPHHHPRPRLRRLNAGLPRNTPTLTVSDLSQLDEGNYDVVVIGYTNATGAPPAALTVLPYPGTLMLYEPFDYPDIGGTVSTNTPANWATGGSGSFRV